MMEFVYIKLGNLGTFFVVGERYNRLQTSIVCHRVAVVVQAHTIIAYAVNRRDIALILRGASGDECIPILDADIGPVSHHKDDIVVATRLVACPYREAQVVANEQENLHTLVLEDMSMLCGLEKRSSPPWAYKWRLSCTSMDATLLGNGRCANG